MDKLPKLYEKKGDRMRILKWFLLLSALICLSIPTAHASFIDFRSPIFYPGTSDSITRTVDGLTITIESSPRNLYWDSNDGLGILGGDDNDEVDGAEDLTVEFVLPTSAYVDYFLISDLFYSETDSIGAFNEEGKWSVDNGFTWNTFQQTDPTQLPSPASNGTYYLTIGQSINSILFMADDSLRDNDYSLAGVEVSGTPEPATMLLVSTGLLGLAGFRRKFRN